MSLESLYQDIILEHSKQRTGEHLVEVPAGHASADNHQYNPTCGDEINLRLVLSDEQKTVKRSSNRSRGKATAVPFRWRQHRYFLRWHRA